MLGLVIRTVLAAIVVTASTASAGGLHLPLRGVRTVERAGALVAGAEDADSLWQNPAGLGHLRGNGKRALLFDAAYVYQTVDYVALDGTTATNLQPGHGIPTLAGALGIGERLVIAGGMTAPYDSVHRYSTDDTTGSMTFAITAGVAYAVSEQLRIGATVQNHVTRLSHVMTTTACTTAVCDPTDASLAMRLAVTQTDYLAPAGSIGIQYNPTPAVAVGATVQSPVRVSGTGTLAVTVPTAMMFSTATVRGDAASLSYTLPPTLRAGIEVRPRDDLRVEVALDVELWGIPDAITIAPDDVAIENVSGGPYPLGEISIARHGKTSFAPSIGVEWHPRYMMFGAGYAYETSATPAGDVSLLSVDSAKHIIGFGGGYEDAGWQIGAAVGVALLADVDVSVSDAAVLQQAPLRDPPTTVPINAGRYESMFVVGGLRAARRF